MIRTLFHTLVLPLALGAAIMLVIIVVYWVLEALLAGRTDYNRGVWEGAAIALVMNGGYDLAHRVLRRVAPKKDEDHA